MAKILVTGGAGFIGSNLTEALLREGHSVRVLDNFSTGKKENLAFEKKYPGFEIIEGDIVEQKVCRAAMEAVDYVFHEAALPSVQQSVEDPLTSNRVNVEGTLNILVAAKNAGVKRVIFASSCAIYGDDPTLPKREEMAPDPLSPYALGKYVGERYGRLFSRLYGLETVSLRYFNVFGPRQSPESDYAAVIPKFIDALLRGNSPIVYGDGEQSRDFVFVEDVVRANLLAMSHGHLHGEVLNVASGKGLSLNDLLSVLGDILDSKVSPVFREPRPGDIRHSRGDGQKAKGLLDFTPTVGMKTGLEKTIAYFIRKRKETGGR